MPSIRVLLALLTASSVGCTGQMEVLGGHEHELSPNSVIDEHGHEGEEEDPFLPPDNTPVPNLDAGVAPAPEPVPAPVGGLAIAAAPSLSVLLNDSKALAVNVSAAAGVTGTVTFSVEGLPQGVTGTFEPASININGTGSTQLTLKVASDAVATPNAAVSIKAQLGAESATAPLALTVPAELLVTIPKGVSLGAAGAPNVMAFGALSWPVIQVAPGTKVTFVNLDAVNHQIHSDGTVGVGHQPGPLRANGASAFTATFSAKGTLNFRCHIHPNMIGQIVVR